MSIDRVAVRLQSPSLPVASLTEIAGRPATRSTHRGTPVSSRRPEGPSHEVSTVLFEQHGTWDTLDGFVDAIGGLLDRIATAETEFGELQVDLIVKITARPLGYMVELGADHLERLRAANCGIVFDVYSSIDDH